jgi:hypothetical protein
MGDTVQLKGAGGCVWEFELPLPEVYAQQLESGTLQPADDKSTRLLAGDSDETDDNAEDELEALRAEYEDVFGEAPHHNKKAETLRKEIDAKLEE